MFDPGGPSLSGLTWLGHSTVVIDLDGTRLVTDPVLHALGTTVCAGVLACLAAVALVHLPA